MDSSDPDSFDESETQSGNALNSTIRSGNHRCTYTYKRKGQSNERVSMEDSKRSKRVPTRVQSWQSEVSESATKASSAPKTKESNNLGSGEGKHKGPCEVCKTVTTRICLCQKVFYCSKKHEDQDYLFHKSNCFPFTVPMKRSLGSFVNQSNRSYSSGATKGIIPLEDRYVVARDDVKPGTVLFKESPILIAPNYVDTILNEEMAKSFCLGCLEDFNGFIDKDKKCVVFSMCFSCKLPLCKNCYMGKENGKHSQYECVAIKDACKLGDLLNVKNKRPYQNEELIKDLTVLRALLLQKTNFSHWTAFINLKFNVRFTQSLRTTPDVVKTWVKTKTPISENYLNKNERFFRLEDVKRIIALFSTTSEENPRIRVLYDFISWMPQSCRPNAAKCITTTTNHEITVKAVGEICPNREISINYITDYEGGLMTASVKLYSETAMICGCEHCKHDVFDTSVGVYCNTEKCRGFLSPKASRLDPGSSFPDVHSANHIWHCDVCGKQRKFISIKKHVDGTLKELRKDITDFSAKKYVKSFSVLRDNIEKKLHKNHWLAMKFDEMLLESLNTQIGFGNEMLQNAVSKARPKFFTYSLEKKMKIFIGTPERKGFLKKISDRMGPMSETAGLYKFDAFYVLLIDFLENVKLDCIIDWKANKCDAIEINCHTFTYVKKLEEIRAILEDIHPSLSSSADSKRRDYGRIAEESLEVYSKLYDKITQSSSSQSNTYLEEMILSYTIFDPSFPRNIFKGSQLLRSKRLIFGDSHQIAMKFEDLHIDGCEEESLGSYASTESDVSFDVDSTFDYDYETASSSDYESRFYSHINRFTSQLPPELFNRRYQQRPDSCHIT